MVVYGFISQEELIRSRLKEGVDKIFEVGVQIVVENGNSNDYFYTLEWAELCKHAHPDTDFTEKYCLDMLSMTGGGVMHKAKEMINKDNVVLTSEFKLISTSRIKEAQLVLR